MGRKRRIRHERLVASVAKTNELSSTTKKEWWIKIFQIPNN